MMTLKQIQSAVACKVGERDMLGKQLKESKRTVVSLRHEKENIEKATEIIQTVAQLTQKQLEYHISEVVTLALEAVFPRPYKFVVNFVLRRNRTEADLLLEDEAGNQVNPMDATGGGVVDVAAFALRVAIWTLSKHKLRNTLIMDEPFRFISTDLQPRAGEMLKEISKKLGIQMIIISHEEELLDAADKVFRVTNRKGKSVISLKE